MTIQKLPSDLVTYRNSIVGFDFGEKVSIDPGVWGHLSPDQKKRFSSATDDQKKSLKASWESTYSQYLTGGGKGGTKEKPTTEYKPNAEAFRGLKDEDINNIINNLKAQGYEFRDTGSDEFRNSAKEFIDKQGKYKPKTRSVMAGSAPQWVWDPKLKRPVQRTDSPVTVSEVVDEDAQETKDYYAAIEQELQKRREQAERSNQAFFQQRDESLRNRYNYYQSQNDVNQAVNEAKVAKARVDKDKADIEHQYNQINLMKARLEGEKAVETYQYGGKGAQRAAKFTDFITNSDAWKRNAIRHGAKEGDDVTKHRNAEDFKSREESRLDYVRMPNGEIKLDPQGNQMQELVTETIKPKESAGAFIWKNRGTVKDTLVDDIFGYSGDTKKSKKLKGKLEKVQTRYTDTKKESDALAAQIDALKKGPDKTIKPDNVTKGVAIAKPLSGKEVAVTKPAGGLDLDGIEAGIKADQDKADKILATEYQKRDLDWFLKRDEKKAKKLEEQIKSEQRTGRAQAIKHGVTNVVNMGSVGLDAISSKHRAQTVREGGMENLKRKQAKLMEFLGEDTFQNRFATGTLKGGAWNPLNHIMSHRIRSNQRAYAKSLQYGGQFSEEDIKNINTLLAYDFSEGTTSNGDLDEVESGSVPMTWQPEEYAKLKAILDADFESIDEKVLEEQTDFSVSEDKIKQILALDFSSKNSETETSTAEATPSENKEEDVAQNVEGEVPEDEQDLSIDYSNFDRDAVVELLNTSFYAVKDKEKKFQESIAKGFCEKEDNEYSKFLEEASLLADSFNIR